MSAQVIKLLIIRRALRRASLLKRRLSAAVREPVRPARDSISISQYLRAHSTLLRSPDILVLPDRAGSQSRATRVKVFVKLPATARSPRVRQPVHRSVKASRFSLRASEAALQSNRLHDRVSFADSGRSADSGSA